MYFVLVILAVIACVLLGAIVLIQNPKGGGLTSNFSSSSQLMGVQKTGDFLEKGTWILAIGLMVLSLAINVSVKGVSGSAGGAETNRAAEKASAPTTQGTIPTPKTAPAPANQAPAATGSTGKK